MGMTTYEAGPQMNVRGLADLSADELERQWWNAPADEDCCLELFRRAVVDQTDQAWSRLQQCLSETIRRWIHGHPCRDVALLRDSEENYIAQTFSRLWYAVQHQQIEFATLPAALSYLHATLNGIIMDTFRSHLRTRAREVPFPEPGCSAEPAGEDAVFVDDRQFWQIIHSLLPDERERRLTYLLYHCGLKPREIVKRCSAEFDDIKEIYRLNHNIIERLRRNRDRLRYLLGSSI
jgi:hypothetical protein